MPSTVQDLPTSPFRAELRKSPPTALWSATSCRKYICQTASGLIGASAFAHSGLCSILIPQGVTRIAEECFLKCRDLLELQLPETLQDLEPSAFRGCGLRSLRLPSGLKLIPYRCFMECRALETVYIPDSVKRIGSEAFSRCSSLETIRGPEALLANQSDWR